MNATVDLTRARLVEFDNPGGGRLTATRPAAEHAFTTCAVDGNRVAEGSQWTEQQVLTFGRNITVLAEFPVTLADLIPEGCNAFRFKQKGTSLTDTAVYDTTFNAWEVTGHDGCHATLDNLQQELDVDLNTVIPLILTAHPDCVEARR